MTDRIFCRFERKEVNTQYYDCPDHFNCNECSRLIPPNIKAPRSHGEFTSPQKEKKSPPQVDRKEGPFWDSGSQWVYSVDSAKLRHLLSVHRRALEAAQKKALKVFWNEAKKLTRGNLKLKSGLILNRITPEEMSLLEEAERGSDQAIRILIEASPLAIELPFVRYKMVEILHKYKVSESPLNPIREVWCKLLPNRSGGRLRVSNESLRARIMALMNSPLDNILKDLRMREILGEHGIKTARRGKDLSKLIGNIEKRGRVTKHLACQIIESYLPVNAKDLRNSRIRERSGRPVEKMG